MDCKKCGEIDIQTERQLPCSCHIAPPCSSCTDAPFVCDKCGEIYECDLSTYEPSSNYEPIKFPKPRTLKDLDRAKIDWIHTGNGGRSFHDIHGYCPVGTTTNDILIHLRVKDRPSMPLFKSFKSGGYFHLSYFID